MRLPTSSKIILLVTSMLYSSHANATVPDCIPEVKSYQVMVLAGTLARKLLGLSTAIASIAAFTSIAEARYKKISDFPTKHVLQEGIIYGLAAITGLYGKQIKGFLQNRFHSEP